MAVPGFVPLLTCRPYTTFPTIGSGYSTTLPAAGPDTDWLTFQLMDFDASVTDLNKITQYIRIFNRVDPAASALYLQIWDCYIDGVYSYHGLQSQGRVLWSRWGTGDTLADIQAGPGATALLGGGEGESLSLRKEYGELPVGDYTSRFERQEFDGTGDWWAYYVQFPGQTEDLIGRMRFHRTTVGVPAKSTAGGMGVECWDYQPGILPPQWRVAIKTLGNNNLLPDRMRAAYKAQPNADIYAEYPPGEYMHHVLGGATTRNHTYDTWPSYTDVWNNIDTTIPPSLTNTRVNEIKWKAPTSGGTPTGYKLYRGTSSGSLSLYQTISNGNLFFIDRNWDGLTVADGTTYYYSLTPYNADGDGPSIGPVVGNPPSVNSLNGFTNITFSVSSPSVGGITPIIDTTPEVVKVTSQAQLTATPGPVTVPDPVPFTIIRRVSPIMPGVMGVDDKGNPVI